MCVFARLFCNPSELLLVVLVLPEHHYYFESTHHALRIQRDPVTPVHMEVSDEMYCVLLLQYHGSLFSVSSSQPSVSFPW